MALANNLGFKVHTQTIDWGQLCRRAWGSEFNAPDHGMYEFSNGRKWDSTDRGTTGVYSKENNLGLMIDNARYPDMPAFLLVENGYQLDQD